VSEAKQEMWAVVELMGHVKMAGRVSEEERFGAKMGRIEIPQEDGSFVTQFFGGGSVYRITAVTEEAARLVAKAAKVQPISPWDLPRALAGPTGTSDDEVFDDDDR
jgi:hypothetical protein